MIKQVTQFLKEVKIEFSKVEWPKFNDFIGALMVTILFMIVFAVYLGIVDRVITFIARQVLKSGL